MKCSFKIYEIQQSEIQGESNLEDSYLRVTCQGLFVDGNRYIYFMKIQIGIQGSSVYLVTYLIPHHEYNEVLFH